jgi:hypothetical protein
MISRATRASRLALSAAQHRKVTIHRDPLFQESHGRLDAPDVKNIFVNRKPDVPDREIIWQYSAQISGPLLDVPE